MTDLFSPLTLGAIDLKNRIVMAPLTRSRAGSAGIPGPLNAEYYAQRATAGMIITEATNISPQGRGYAYTPGIFNDEQVAGWKLVTDAVHEKGGKIVCQLWHVGRISHESLQPPNPDGSGGLPVAPSAVRPDGNAFTESGFQPHPTPHALTVDEITAIVGDYRHATRCAREAGFDGVEIHAANGYLIDQFLRRRTNRRTDAYGTSSIEDQTRFLLEATRAVVGAWDAAHVGIRLSPVTPANDMGTYVDAADTAWHEKVFTHAVEQLHALGLAFLEMVEGATGGPRHVDREFDLQKLAHIFKGRYIANNGYDQKLAEETLAAGRADAIAFGKPFIANPDLPARLKQRAELAAPDLKTFYGGDAHGYTDYPALV